jgi:hypothetical protein
MSSSYYSRVKKINIKLKSKKMLNTKEFEELKFFAKKVAEVH